MDLIVALERDLIVARKGIKLLVGKGFNSCLERDLIVTRKRI